MSDDLLLYNGAVSNERFVLIDLPLSYDLPLAEVEVLDERVPELKLLPGRSLPTLPLVVMELPLSRAAVFLRMFSAPLLVSALVNREVLDEPLWRVISDAGLVFLVTGSTVATLFVFLSTTRFEMSLASRPDLSETLSPRSCLPS